jgi:hypothetical protein
LHHGLLAFDGIEFVRGNANDQAISAHPKAFQQPNVPNMKQVKRSVC